jgi:hypothetical protein
VSEEKRKLDYQTPKKRPARDRELWTHLIIAMAVVGAAMFLILLVLSRIQPRTSPWFVK